MYHTTIQKRIQRILVLVRESRQSIRSFPVDPDIYRELKKSLLPPAHRGGR